MLRHTVIFKSKVSFQRSGNILGKSLYCLNMSKPLCTKPEKKMVFRVWSLVWPGAPTVKQTLCSNIRGQLHWSYCGWMGPNPYSQIPKSDVKPSQRRKGCYSSILCPWFWNEMINVHIWEYCLGVHILFRHESSVTVRGAVVRAHLSCPQQYFG